MGAACCKSNPNVADNHNTVSLLSTDKLTAEDVEERRRIQARAAEERAKTFKQGGGGEKAKAKSKSLEEAEKKNKESGPALDARAFD